MSALEKIAFYQNRRDEVPNQELARELSATRDVEGIQEIADGLRHKDPHVQADCLKALYELGFLNPELVAGFYPEFLRLLSSKNNRLVWGAMIALGTIVDLRSAEIGAHLGEILNTMRTGSVITVDNGIKILSGLAAQDKAQRLAIMPVLIEHLATCRPKDIPQHAEKIAVAIDGDSKAEFAAVLERRVSELSPAQADRVKKIIKRLSA